MNSAKLYLTPLEGVQTKIVMICKLSNDNILSFFKGKNNTNNTFTAAAANEAHHPLLKVTEFERDFFVKTYLYPIQYFCHNANDIIIYKLLILKLKY